MLATKRLLMILVAGSALVAAGCGRSNSSSSSSTTTTTPTTTTAGVSSVALSADPNGALSFNTKTATAKAGQVRFVMKNPGSSGVQHGIAVEGNGVDKDGPIVQPGGTSVL